MDSETWLYVVLVGLGLLLMLGVMICFVNPPEAWIKKVLNRQSSKTTVKTPRT